jgi:sialate O-acetylesterase
MHHSRHPSIGLPLLFMSALLRAAPVHAEPPSLLYGLFQDHAVLQRDKPIAVWGSAAPGEIVTISLAAASVRAQTDSAGQWSAVLPAMSTGGPFVLAARGSSGAAQSARDILVGDVFLCSGQSNMELPVQRAGNSQSEIDNSADDTIRMLTVGHSASPVPLREFAGPLTWQIADPKTVPEWSAACFFFARELQASIHVPIGLVHSSWSGSNIRPWISAAALQSFGALRPSLDTLAEYAKNQAAAQSRFAAQWEDWWRSKTANGTGVAIGIGAEPWSARAPSSPHSPASPSSAAAHWQSAPAQLGDWRYWGVPQLEDFTGLLWYRTHIHLSAAQARSGATLILGPVNQVDETWLNGRALGNTFGYGTDRSYGIAAGMLHAGDNFLVINVLSTYGGGGLLSGGTRRTLQLSGGESIPLDGPWEYCVVPAAIGYPPRAPWESVGGLSTLYNAMIAPLGSYGIRGVLWYQGESNTGEPETYQALLTALMADWRRQFGAELPFLIVQLPNFGPPPIAPGESGWAALREAQRQAVAHDGHAGLAVTIDIGDAHNLHPTNKQDVGKRLARAARGVIYGETLSASGPLALGAARDGGRIAVQFGAIERGLVAYSHDSPIGFELCADAPGTCRFAESRIDGNRVLLSAAQPVDPTRVRYCWADSPLCSLFDLSGLPAGPFELRIQP